MNGQGLLVQPCLLSLSVPILSGSEDQGLVLVGHRDDDHTVVLLTVTLLQAPNVMRLVGGNSIELFDL